MSRLLHTAPQKNVKDRWSWTLLASLLLRQRHRPWNRTSIASIAAIATLGLLVATSGCAGDLPPGFASDSGDRRTLDVGIPLIYDQGTLVPVDTGTIKTQDKGADSVPKPDTMKPDTMKPDTMKPDTDPAPPQAGGPCPCAAGLYCISNVCRATCPIPNDPCKVATTCPAQHACVQTNKAGIWVCVPSTTPGSPCSASVFCPTNYVCASVNYAANVCLPTCPNGTCGGGGQCLVAKTGCQFCSTP